jgi:hypothetical protein
MTSVQCQKIRWFKKATINIETSVNIVTKLYVNGLINVNSGSLSVLVYFRWNKQYSYKKFSFLENNIANCYNVWMLKTTVHVVTMFEWWKQQCKTLFECCKQNCTW